MFNNLKSPFEFNNDKNDTSNIEAKQAASLEAASDTNRKSQKQRRQGRFLSRLEGPGISLPSTFFGLSFQETTSHELEQQQSQHLSLLRQSKKEGNNNAKNSISSSYNEHKNNNNNSESYSPEINQNSTCDENNNNNNNNSTNADSSSRETSEFYRASPNLQPRTMSESDASSPLVGSGGRNNTPGSSKSN